VRFVLPHGWPGIFCVAAALLLLNASLTFANVWPTANIRWQNAFSIEFAVLLVLIAIFRPAVTSRVRRVLPVVWLLLVIGHYLDVTAPGLYGRDFNLYWDAPHIGNVVAMIAEAAPVWLIVGAVLGAVLMVAAAYTLFRIALGWLVDAAARQHGRRVLSSIGVTLIALFAWQHATENQRLAVAFADPVSSEYVHQLRSVAAMFGQGAVAPTLPASPVALNRPPTALDGADVFLIFVESYGALTFDTPEIASGLGPSRAEFVEAARATGRHIVSAFAESPTFGGSSWLAHLTLMSGVPVRDPLTYQSLMTEQRDTLSTAFTKAGYRAVALMPGMRQAWPEGAFYRYARIYGRDDLAYQGPRFGWWSIPDQYSLAKLDELEGRRGSRAPLFVVFPTSTTHAPFGPVAPYQPDWGKVLGGDAYDADEVERILARPPDLQNLTADYTHAMSYEFTTFAGYLRERAQDDLVMILVGDHQPPAAVSGKNAPWTVPVHVVTSKTELVTRLLASGFIEGLTPSRPSIGEMHELVPTLLDAFTGVP
jgi:hypothetical protein